MPAVTGYDMQLYCDYRNPEHKHGEFPHCYFDESKLVCWRACRRAGWTFQDKRRVAKCPKCSRAGIRLRAREDRP